MMVRTLILIIFILANINIVRATEPKSNHYQCIIINNPIFKKHYIGFEAATEHDVMLIFKFDKKDYIKTPLKFECELNELEAKEIKPFLVEQYFKTGLYIKAPIKIDHQEFTLKTGMLYLSYAPMSLARDALFEDRLAHCDFVEQQEVVGLNLVKYGKKPYCLLMEKGHHSYLGVDKKDDAKVELNCWDQVKSCSMSVDYRKFKLEVNEIPKDQIQNWQQIKTQIIANFEDNLVMHFISPKQCEGEYCETFLKTID